MMKNDLTSISYIRYIILKQMLYKSRNSYAIKEENISPSVRNCLENCIFP